MIRLVLFDIDGTLIRTGGAGAAAFDRTFSSQFKISNATRGMNLAGRTDVALVREALTRNAVPATPENFELFFSAYVFWLERTLHETKGWVCAGVDRFLASARARANPPLIGLLTGNIALGAEIKLRHYGLWPEFQFGAFADDHEIRNEIAVAARRRGEARLGPSLKGEEILVIGDTPFDVACGRHIGAKVLAVATGGSSFIELKKHRPDWLVADLAEAGFEDFCG